MTQTEFSLIGTLIKNGHKEFCPAQMDLSYIAECGIAYFHIYEFVNNGVI